MSQTATVVAPINVNFTSLPLPYSANYCVRCGKITCCTVSDPRINWTGPFCQYEEVIDQMRAERLRSAH